MKVGLITATKNRHTQLEHCIRFSLNQDYDNMVHLIYNNAGDPQELHESLPKGKYILINNHIDLYTGKPYTNLGAIYRDALFFLPDSVDIINFFDDDDIFLPYHVSEGVKGFQKGQKKAYKPELSYFKNGHQVSLTGNNMEPSIFVLRSHIVQYGFHLSTSDQHMAWLTPLLEQQQLFVDKVGTPTLLYTWGNHIPTFKTSGAAGNPNNFENYAAFSKDIGDGIITPIENEVAQKLYQLS